MSFNPSLPSSALVSCRAACLIMPETQFQVLLAPVGDTHRTAYPFSTFLSFFKHKNSKQKMLVGSHQTTPLMYRDGSSFPANSRMRQGSDIHELCPNSLFPCHSSSYSNPIKLPLIHPNTTLKTSDSRSTQSRSPPSSAPAAKPAYDQN